MRDEERDADRLELILKLISGLNRRLSILTLDAFRENEDEIDLASFRFGDNW